ncbi:hypothetical protein HYH03_009886 [Edaphochlamys debaryana]|uniref:Uncharacterized protein n=1 Tax=Edaphochlamys debaryana TaxID=47281 RepID=A0A835XZ75_9CHLO|nr:hypothetical protein HYH03_009886 [Edaphochlamys debaryana]|eukprot:KAG2491723.1 hypothetical protein HYH03_009886 [Edaphochlamys debaryana]
MVAVPSLLEASCEVIVHNITKYTTLEGLPEDLLVYLFQRVLQEGKLSPRVLKLFKAAEYPSLHEQIRALGLRDPPPVVRDTAGRWLGDKPSLY